MNKYLVSALAGLAILAAGASSAHAGPVSVGISIGVPAPFIYAPAPVYYPQQAYYPPPPVYYAPRVVYAPPVYYAPRPVYARPYYDNRHYHHRHGR
jgi:hypothetical protein